MLSALKLVQINEQRRWRCLQRKRAAEPASPSQKVLTAFLKSIVDLAIPHQGSFLFLECYEGDGQQLVTMPSRSRKGLCTTKMSGRLSCDIITISQHPLAHAPELETYKIRKTDRLDIEKAEGVPATHCVVWINPDKQQVY